MAMEWGSLGFRLALLVLTLVLFAGVVFFSSDQSLSKKIREEWQEFWRLEKRRWKHRFIFRKFKRLRGVLVSAVAYECPNFLRDNTGELFYAGNEMRQSSAIDNGHELFTLEFPAEIDHRYVGLGVKAVYSRGGRGGWVARRFSFE